jgi:hypothetical protein
VTANSDIMVLAEQTLPCVEERCLNLRVHAYSMVAKNLPVAVHRVHRYPSYLLGETTTTLCKVAFNYTD